MVKCWHVSRIYKQKTWLISPEEARNPRKTRQLDTLINLLNVDHHPRERICVDTHFSPCVMQHLSHRSHTIPTSHFADSWEMRAGMRHEIVLDPNVSPSWRVSDGTSSASVILGRFCSMSITERGWKSPSFSQTDIWILLTFCVRIHKL